MNLSKQRTLNRVRCFLFLFLTLPVVADPTRTALLWQEFTTIYNKEGLARLSPEEIEAQALDVLKLDPANRLHAARITATTLLPTLEELAVLRKKDAFDLAENLIQKFSASRSPFETYLTANNYNLLSEARRGSRAGAGMRLNRDASGRDTLTPYTGSPAEKAGVLEGDELIEIAGKPTLNLSIPEIQSLVGGPEGSELPIRVRRASGGTQLLRILRGIHREPYATLEKSLTGHTLRIRTFNDGSAELVKSLLSQIPEGSRLTLDLRGNPGGDLQEAVTIISLFTPAEAVLLQRRKADGVTEVIRDTDDIFFQPKSLSLLVDRHTASAAELMVAALLGKPGVSLQGERTFGKSKLLSVFKTVHGGLLTIETEELSGPAGKSWEAGIDPATWAETGGGY